MKYDGVTINSSLISTSDLIDELLKRDEFSIGRWFIINGEMTHIQFNHDKTYINGVSVQYQNDTDYIVHQGE